MRSATQDEYGFGSPIWGLDEVDQKPGMGQVEEALATLGQTKQTQNQTPGQTAENLTILGQSNQTQDQSLDHTKQTLVTLGQTDLNM